MVVSGHPREVPAHSSCPQHEHRWSEEDRLRHHCHQGRWQTLRTRRPEESRHRPQQEGRRADGGGGRTGGDHHAEPSSVQNPRLVPQQAERREGRQIQPGPRQRPGQQAERRPGEAEEDPGSPWSQALLGSPCAWSAHKDHRPSRSHRRCVQEEVNSLLPFSFNKTVHKIWLSWHFFFFFFTFQSKWSFLNLSSICFTHVVQNPKELSIDVKQTFQAFF